MKTCIVCDALIHRRESESASNYKRKKLCSPDCKRLHDAALKRGITYEQAKRDLNTVKNCKHCRKPFTKPKRLSFPEYERQQFCSQACARFDQQSQTKPGRRRRDSKPAALSGAALPLGFVGSPKPDPVPTAKPSAPLRAPQALLRALASTIAIHPELRVALLDPTFVDITPHTLDRLRAYGGPANAGFNRA